MNNTRLLLGIQAARAFSIALALMLFACQRKQATSVIITNDINISSAPAPTPRGAASSNHVLASLQDRANSNEHANLVDEAKVRKYVEAFRSSYMTRTGLMPRTLQTIALARELRTNTTLSISTKLQMIHRQPSSMASKGAELFLYKSEYAKANLSLEEKIHLLRNMSAIYKLFFHAEECIANIETQVRLLAAADMREELAAEYENIASCYMELVDDPNKALDYYYKALDIGKNLKGYDTDSLIGRLLKLHMSLGERSAAQKLFDAYDCAGKNEFAFIESCLAHPNSKVTICKNTLTIEGDVGEIAGLAELKRNLTKTTQPQVRKYLYQVLATQLSIEEQNHL